MIRLLLKNAWVYPKGASSLQHSSVRFQSKSSTVTHKNRGVKNPEECKAKTPIFENQSNFEKISYSTTTSYSEKECPEKDGLHKENSEQKFLLPNVPKKTENNNNASSILYFDQKAHPNIEVQPYQTPYQKNDVFTENLTQKPTFLYSKLSEAATKRAIRKAASKNLYYRDPLTLNVIQIDGLSGELVELKNTGTSLEFYNIASHEANIYAKKSEFYLSPMDYTCTKNSREIIRLWMSFSPKSFENKWFVQGSMVPVSEKTHNAFALKVCRETNEIMMVRDVEKKINPNVYATRMDGNVSAGLAHTHPGKPVSFPEIDTREYGITQNYTRKLKEDWHKYDHKWYGGVYRFLVLVLIFFVCPSVYRLNQKVGYTLCKCTDDPEKRFTDYGYETQSEWYTLSDSKCLNPENPSDSKIISSREKTVQTIKLLIDSGLLMNCETEDNFEEVWAEVEPFLSESIYFSEGRPWRKTDGIVSGKNYLKKRLFDWWTHNQARKSRLSPEYQKALNLIQYHPFDLTFEFPVHPITPGLAIGQPDLNQNGKEKWIYDTFQFVRDYQHNCWLPGFAKQYLLGVNRGNGDYEIKHVDDQNSGGQIHIESKNFDAWKDLDDDFKNKGIVYQYYYGTKKTRLDRYVEEEDRYGSSESDKMDFENAKFDPKLGQLVEKRDKWPQRTESDLLRNERIWTISRPAENTGLYEHMMTFYKHNLERAQSSSRTADIAEITSRMMTLEQLSRDHYQINLDDDGRIKEFLIYRNGYTPYHVFKRYSGLWSFFSADNLDNFIITTLHGCDWFYNEIGEPVCKNYLVPFVSPKILEWFYLPNYARWELEKIAKENPEFGAKDQKLGRISEKRRTGTTSSDNLPEISNKTEKGQKLKLNPDGE